MQLCYLQTRTEVGGEHNSTVIFPMPLDIVKTFLDILDKKAENALALPLLTGIRIKRVLMANQLHD